MRTPTLSLFICDPQHHTLATIEDLPVPIRIESDSDHTEHVKVLTLEPAMTAACQAFTHAWKHSCEQPTT